MKMTKKTEEKLKTGVNKFQKVLRMAKERDLNESDTVAIITDVLAEVFGYDKYEEITSELAIRGTYCDLAIKMGNNSDKYKYLIECKAVGIELKEIHLRQATSYGANKGIEWVVLTNGIDWRIYRLRFEQPLTWDLVASFNFLTIDFKDEHEVEKLFMLTKEGVEKEVRTEMYEKTQCINRFICGQLILSDAFVAMLRREFRKLADGITVDEDEVREMLKREVLKQDVLQGEECEAAAAKVNKFYRAVARKAEKTVAQKAATPQPVEAKPEVSLTEQLLAEADKQDEAEKQPGEVAPCV